MPEQSDAEKGDLMKEKEFLDILEKYGQKEFTEVYKSLSEEDSDKILEQAELLDFDMLEKADPTAVSESRGVIEPIKTLTMAEYADKKEHYREVGLKAIREGKIGAIVLAGGMGTRLGYDHAKGMCDIGINRNVFIFQRTIENALDVVREAGCFFHLYVMTSYINDEETKQFMELHDYFGYSPEFIHFYKQDMSPCLDSQGRMFLSDVDEIAMSPNGNGGFYSSLVNSGLGRRAKEAGIEYMNVFAVDNVLQRIVDPVFVGATIESGCATGAKVVKKSTPDEKVGAICLEDGTPSVVEYYEMTPELMEAKLSDGSPAYDYGVILNYLFRLRDIDDVVKEKLPVHMVKKKVPYLGVKDGVPAKIDPPSPNAYKLETLTLDLVHLTDSCLSFEVEREREFAPIKNATGVDSVESARELLRRNGIEL